MNVSILSEKKKEMSNIEVRELLRSQLMKIILNDDLSQVKCFTFPASVFADSSGAGAGAGSGASTGSGAGASASVMYD